MIGRIILFLVLNFSALGIGGLFTPGSISSDWYQNLKIAPWTPPGWVFGFAWTSIMICFSIYMAYAVKSTDNLKMLLILYTIQWILNVAWNPAFFYYHQVLFALYLIITLTILIGYIFVHYATVLKMNSLYLLPYLVWMIIATSLNAYIFIKN